KFLECCVFRMENPPSNSGTREDNSGIPDDLRCKRSDGKQWRCTAMSMPDKTVCEKHYVQAKKRAANSAMRASMKKAKRKSIGESDIYLESKSDDMGSPLDNQTVGDYAVPVSGKKYKEKVPQVQVSYSPETTSVRSFTTRNPLKPSDDLQRDVILFEENGMSYKTPPSPAVESSRSKSQKIFDTSAMMETSDGSSDSSDDNGGQTCHQCRQKDRNGVVWCLRCDKRGYCNNCIYTWYSAIPLEEIQKVKIREIPVQEKLEYLYCLLSSVLHLVTRIHDEQCSEVELERRLRGNEIDLARTKLNADEQMCCDFCRIPVIDYHRHCMSCSYDICLNCCQDLREASMLCIKGEVEYQTAGRSDAEETVSKLAKPSKLRLNMSEKFPGWKANNDGSIPCPPKEYGGCGFSSLTLRRIFKMNWVAKLVKNVEEMVSGCKVYDAGLPQKSGFNLRLRKFANRENDGDNCIYCPSFQDIKTEGIGEFRKHWISGEPVVVSEVCEIATMASWDPMVIWGGIRETAEEKMKDDSRTVKAIDYLDWSEVDIELDQFIKGYSEGRNHEHGWPQMLKLKNWPSPSAFEEFLLYQRPEFINKLPLLEYIHSKWGLLNVAAKLPHYSLQNDAGPKIYISYGTDEELGRGDAVDNLHLNMRDVVYLLVHTCQVKLKSLQRAMTERAQEAFKESVLNNLSRYPQISLDVGLDKGGPPKLSSSEQDKQIESKASLDSTKDERMEDEEILCTKITTTAAASTTSCTTTEERTANCEDLNWASGEMTANCEDLKTANGDTFERSCPGALWDVFRRQDVPKLIDYLRIHWKEFEKPDTMVPCPLYDGVIYLNQHHKRKLKEEFRVEPWSFQQHLGEAVFIPAGCPFQVRNLQSTVQLSLDFLSPESLGEAARSAEEIRCLPNDHDAKLQMLEVGKVSLYAASSAIKEVRKLVLDPKLGAELGFEDPNLTAKVSENLETMIKRRPITCSN
ncbi:hypothetical protein RJ639_038579, partial [Escallonia herrerae]